MLLFALLGVADTKGQKLTGSILATQCKGGLQKAPRPEDLGIHRNAGKEPAELARYF